MGMLGFITISHCKMHGGLCFSLTLVLAFWLGSCCWIRAKINKLATIFMDVGSIASDILPKPMYSGWIVLSGWPGWSGLLGVIFLWLAAGRGFAF